MTNEIESPAPEETMNIINNTEHTMTDFEHDIRLEVDTTGELARKIGDVVRDHYDVNEITVRAVSLDVRTDEGELVVSVPVMPDRALEVLDKEAWTTPTTSETTDQ